MGLVLALERCRRIQPPRFLFGEHCGIGGPGECKTPPENQAGKLHPQISQSVKSRFQRPNEKEQTTLVERHRCNRKQKESEEKEVANAI